MKPQYCHQCGRPVSIKKVDGIDRAYCDHCDLVIYENPLPSVAILAHDTEGRVLLVRRKVQPGIGEWSLAGGFIELGETAREAALRELKEETGLEGSQPRIFDVGSHLNGYYGDVLILAFTVQIIPQPLLPGDDVSEAVFFYPSERPRLIFRVHEQFLSHWEREQGLRRGER